MSGFGGRRSVVSILVTAAIPAGCGDLLTPPTTQLVRVQGDESTLYCWGTSYQGQLGVPGIEEARTPIPSARGLTFRWLSASVGGHICGLRSNW